MAEQLTQGRQALREGLFEGGTGDCLGTIQGIRLLTHFQCEQMKDISGSNAGDGRVAKALEC